MKVLLASLTIIGTVIGSGFISGKEIVVFFSRFGWFSFPCIFIAFLLFFFLFKFILNNSQFALKRINQSKAIFSLNCILCLIFSSAMFAGIANLLTFDKKIFNFILFFLVIMFCILIFKFGLKGLNKLNMLFVPFMLIIFMALICSKISLNFKPSSYSITSFIYCILYVILNTANSGIVLAGLAKDLTKRQKTQVAFWSALVLFVILITANIVLLANPTSFDYAMPLVSLFSAFEHIVMTLLVLVGCLTTLLTLVYTLSSSMRGLCKNEILIFITSIILPLILSLLGFGYIVEFLYPLASILGIYLLADLFFVPFLKGTYEKIHSARKQTKDNNT